MNKEDIKKSLVQCSDFVYCGDCPYFNWEDMRCRDKLQRDALNLITEQEKEINALQEENRRLDEYVSCTLSAQEFDEEIKQAKIDVLNELKRQPEHCDQWNCEVVPTRYIDKMIEEIENADKD